MRSRMQETLQLVARADKPPDREKSHQRGRQQFQHSVLGNSEHALPSLPAPPHTSRIQMETHIGAENLPDNNNKKFKNVVMTNFV